MVAISGIYDIIKIEYVRRTNDTKVIRSKYLLIHCHNRNDNRVKIPFGPIII